MRRSQLEKEINDWLDSSVEITGKTILDLLESKGMVPPKILLVKTGKGCLCTMREGCEECDPYGQYFVNKWESENEAK
jgi:hypothetical protein